MNPYDRTIKLNPELLALARQRFPDVEKKRIAAVWEYARWAGATRVDITNSRGIVEVVDNGRGFRDIGTFLETGKLDSGDLLQTTKGPTALGLFALSSHELEIFTRGLHVYGLSQDCKRALVREESEYIEGTRLRFNDGPWFLGQVLENTSAVSEITIVVDGKSCHGETDLQATAPRFTVGLLSAFDPPRPVTVPRKNVSSISGCYKLNPSLLAQARNNIVEIENAHLLAALGKCNPPFVPVSIDAKYDGCIWAQIPTIDSVDVSTGKIIGHGNALVRVESLVITARTSDGKTHRSRVPIAIDGSGQRRNGVYVTAAASHRLSFEEFWYHLGGRFGQWYSEYDMACSLFSLELEEALARSAGPYEYTRRRIAAATEDIKEEWEAVEALPNGCITIRLARDGTDQGGASREIVVQEPEGDDDWNAVAFENDEQGDEGHARDDEGADE